MPKDPALAALAPLARRWFEARFPKPTAAQQLAWPAIAAGKHCLLVAPTGSGKTLAAFLAPLGRLAAEALAMIKLRWLALGPGRRVVSG